MNLQKKELLRWTGWFFAANVLLYWLIGLKYLPTVSWLNTNYLNLLDKISLVAFFTLSYLGQLAILALLPAILIIFLICIFPRRHFIFAVSIIVTVFTALLLLTDTIVYNLFRFHLNGIILNLILHSSSEQFFDLSQHEIILTVSIVSGLSLLEFFIAYGLWRRLIKRPFLTGLGTWIAVLIGLSFYTSYSVLVFAANKKIGRIFIETARVLPFYTEFLAAMLPMPDGQRALERAFEKNLIQPDQASEQLLYPLQPLQFSKPTRHLNVIIISIDAWRFDAIDPVVMPNVFQLAKQSTNYQQHFSGGNATGPGIFSLFYGLPATYWTSTKIQKRGPLLIEEFLHHHYQMKILASAGLSLPPFHKTVFQAVPNLQLKMRGDNPYERDLSVTREFKHFIDKAVKNPQPFFSFLFYDSAHGYCAIANNLRPFTPAIKKCDRLNLTKHSNPTPYLNRYKNSLHLIDEQVGQVINTLKNHRLMEDTVIIVTGDHGEEFNDNHLGYWGHASNYTRFQVQTPLIIYWPHTEPQVVKQLTTHFDISPTLLEKVFGCKTPANQYSMGSSLLNEKKYPYLIVGSYIGFGIIESNRITTIFPTGGFMVTKKDGEQSSDLKLDVPTMQSVFQDIRRFYISR
jgi:membrane-anchored protein YejM (alkaline phosphatase superfamily)